MAETPQANRVRHFELCFVEFAHNVEKLELGKSDSFFLPHTVFSEMWFGEASEYIA